MRYLPRLITLLIFASLPLLSSQSAWSQVYDPTGPQQLGAPGDAISLRGYPIDSTIAPLDGYCFIFVGATGKWTAETCAGGSGGASTPATTSLLKGTGSPNGVTAAIPGADYLVPQTSTVPQQITGVTYYVDSVNGLDTNNGTSLSTPWKTVAKVNSSTFNPGDQVLFLRGDVWHEALTVPSSGSSTAQFVIGNYGPASADLPILDEADPVTSWTFVTGYPGLYKATVSNIGSFAVFVDSLYQPTPSLTYETSSTTVSTTPGSFYWTGTVLYVHLLDGSDPNTHVIEVAQKSRTTGVVAADKSYVTISGLKIIRAMETGIELDSLTSNQGGTYYNQYNVVENNTIFDYGNSPRSGVNPCCAAGGVVFTGDVLAGESPIPGLQILSNTIGYSNLPATLQNYDAGIMVLNSTGAVISGNSVATANTTGIQLRPGATNTSIGPARILNNNLSNNQTGIAAEGAAYVLQANNIHDGFGFGIQAGSGSFILNNTINNLSQGFGTADYNGIDENQDTGVTVAGNKITNIINGCSLDLESTSTGATVTGNYIDGFGDGCIINMTGSSLSGLTLGGNTYVEALGTTTTGFHYGGGGGAATPLTRAQFWATAVNGGGDVTNPLSLSGLPLPALASGYLHYNGTVFVYDTPAGGGTVTSVAGVAPVSGNVALASTNLSDTANLSYLNAVTNTFQGAIVVKQINQRFNALSYLAAPSSLPNSHTVTAGTTTALDQMLADAEAAVLANNTDVVAEIPVSTGGTDTAWIMCHQFVQPTTSTHSVLFIGEGQGGASVHLGDNCTVTGFMIDGQPGSTTGLSHRQYRNLNFNAEGHASLGVIRAAGEVGSIYKDVTFADQARADKPVAKFGDSGLTNGYSYQFNVDNMGVGNNYFAPSGFTRPLCSVAISGDSLSTTMTCANAGAALPVSTALDVYFYGYNTASNLPCTGTQPVATVSTNSSGAVDPTTYSLTTAPTGCTGGTDFVQLGVHIYTTTILDINDASDSTFNNVTVTGNSHNGVTSEGHGGNSFNHLHVFPAPGNMVEVGLKDSYCGNQFTSTSFDSESHYGADLECNVHTATEGDSFYGHDDYWNDNYQGAAGFLMNTSASVIEGGQCGDSQTNGGYVQFMTTAGPVTNTSAASVAALAGNVIHGNGVCSTTNTQQLDLFSGYAFFPNYLAILTPSASVAGVEVGTTTATGYAGFGADHAMVGYDNGRGAFLRGGGGRGLLLGANQSSPTGDAGEAGLTSTGIWWQKVTTTSIASASTIAPITNVTHITGTVAISTITVPSGCSATDACVVELIPDGIWTLATGGNIATAMTATVGVPITVIYDGNTALWYPTLGTSGSGSTNATTINSGTVPASTNVLGTNSSSQPVAATSSNIQTVIGAGVYDASGAATTAQTNAEAAFTGDVTKSANAFATTVTKLNGTSLAGLATGLLKNTTATGIPSIAAAGTDYVVPSGNITGTAANLSGTPALPNGTTATTQAAADNTTKLATDAFVLANALTNPMTTAGDMLYGGTSGVATRLPAASGGTVPMNLIEVPGSAPTFALAGVSGRSVSGATDTIAATDRGSTIDYTGSAATAVTFTSPATLASNFSVVAVNTGTGTVTFTLGAGNFVTASGSTTTLALASGQNCAFSSPDNVNILPRCSTPAAAAGISNIQITVSTTAIAANTCATAATATMTGLATTSTVSFTPASDVSSTTGWSAGTGGALYFTAWPTANTLNYHVCNPTSASITPGASTTWNVSAK